MNNRKKIIFFRGDRGQCWFARGHLPLSYLARNHPDEYEISITGIMDTSQLSGIDVAIFQRQYKEQVFRPMKTMKKNGTKIILEIDDNLFDIPKWNTSHAILGKRVVRENLKAFLSESHAVFVATENLKDVYSRYNDKIYVLPNSIDYSVFKPLPKNSKKKVILWQGSNTHLKDIGLLRPVLEKLSQDDDIYIKLWSIDLNIKNTRVVDFVPLESFYSLFSELDGYIGIAPLMPHVFNKGKSPLKFFEYSVQGMATVASNFGPYKEVVEHEKTGILIDNNKDWYDAIRYLVDNENRHSELVSNAQAFVKENFDMANNYMLWKNAIDEVISS